MENNQPRLSHHTFLLTWQPPEHEAIFFQKNLEAQHLSLGFLEQNRIFSLYGGQNWNFIHYMEKFSQGLKEP